MVLSDSTPPAPSKKKRLPEASDVILDVSKEVKPVKAVVAEDVKKVLEDLPGSWLGSGYCE